MEEILNVIPPRARVLVGSGAACPITLLGAWAARPSALPAEVCSLLLLGELPFVSGDTPQRHNAFFMSPAVRDAMARGAADFTPALLSAIPNLLRTVLKPDVALIQVSPPDANGRCTLGVSVDIVKAAVESAGIVIAEINPNMPRTCGSTGIERSHIHHAVHVDHPIPQLPLHAPNDVELAIGRHVAALVNDRDTLQVGIGAIPNAVLAALRDRRDLGVHTEMFSDGVMDLMQRGVITNRAKSVHPGRTVTSFVMGSHKLYAFVDGNEDILFLPSDEVNAPAAVALNDRMVSINSALSVDLTGQVCADSIGPRIFSGVGGQLDFVRGAQASAGGRSVIALPSTACGGSVSRIAVELAAGSGVTVTRSEVHMVATEYGVAELRGKSIAQRVHLLAGIAHPKFRDELLAGARRHHWI